jgi:phosphoribosyl 1,2-cyclic phosphodiesterase
MIVECNYSDDLLDASEIDRVQKSRIRKSHMSLQTLEKMIDRMDKSRLQKIYLTHLSDRHSDEARFKDRIQRLTGVEVYIL